MTRAALLVIDLLEDFLRTWDAPNRKRLVRATSELIAMAREGDVPVVWVRQEFEPDLSDAFLEVRHKRIPITVRGTPGARVAAELDRRPADRDLVKKRYSAFFGTPLDAVLEELGARIVVLAGVNTHACVRMTAIDAYQRDFEVIIARECVGSYDREHEAVTLRYLDGKIASVLDNAQVRRRLQIGLTA